ncbi:MAG: septal ring lytic transglycosylase RlpA family protein [Acidobacteriota bacterium]
MGRGVLQRVSEALALARQVSGVPVPAALPRRRRRLPRSVLDRGRLWMAPLAMLALTLAILAGGCSSNRFADPTPGDTQRGVASWYGPKFHGRTTANGEVYDMYGLTAAHRELPLGTRIEVTNLDNGRKVTVRVNDRGPFIRGRILDLSYGAAKAVGMIGPGLARVEIRVLEAPPGAHALARIDGGRWTVQVGAFSVEENAHALVRRLEGQYEPIEIRFERGIHRVHVGSLKSRDDALDLRRELSRKGLSAIVVMLP